MERHMEKGKFQFCYKNSIELLRMRNSNVLEVFGSFCEPLRKKRVDTVK